MNYQRARSKSLHGRVLQNNGYHTTRLSKIYHMYQEMVKDILRGEAAIDDNIGKLLDYLDEAGLAENTVVIALRS